MLKEHISIKTEFVQLLVITVKLGMRLMDGVFHAMKDMTLKMENAFGLQITTKDPMI